MKFARIVTVSLLLAGGTVALVALPSHSQSVTGVNIAAGQDSNWASTFAIITQNITDLQTRLAADESKLTAQQQAINNLVTQVAALTPAPAPTPTPTPAPKPVVAGGNVLVVAGGADQGVCQGIAPGISVVPAGATGTVVAGPKTVGSATCWNIAFNAPNAGFSGYTPASGLVGQ